MAVVRALSAAVVGDLSAALCAEAGLARPAVEDAARLLAGQSPVILYGAPLVARAGSDALEALQALATTLGGTLHGLVVQGNAQGARDMGCTPGVGGLSGHEMLVAAANGKLKALYIMGASVLDAADKSLVEKALATVEVLIVHDITSRRLSRVAEALLPGFSFAESDGTFTNVERRVQRLRPALQPVGSMRANWQIVAELAAALTGDNWGYKTASDVFAEITRTVPAYAGLSYSKLGATGVRVP
jgi:predicted molibdopterin-dependent oxidoreductase YjgC